MQDMTLIQVEGHLPYRGPFSNGCKALTDSGFAALIHSLVSSANLDTLLERPRSQKGGAPKLTLEEHHWLQQSSQRAHHWRWPSASFLPTKSQSRQQHCLGCQGLEPSSWAFCEGLYRRLCRSLKRLHPRPSNGHTHRTHIGKVKEVYNTRPTLTKTVLARVDEVICLQEIDHPVLDDGLKDFS